ncbi:MAG: Gfo/Idh/MocA family oxidoreductase [Planctomycetia bacterium]|nr:Gfo/Idh/MocA family oxidoreductase [Planctomycetia bacterium]
MQRRTFVKSCAAGLGLATILNHPASANGTPVNDRVNLALIGCGSISNLHRRQFLEHRKEDDVRFLYAVDAQMSRAEQAAKEVSKPDQATKPTQQMQLALDDKNVDGVIIATPDHWHALATIRACQAGKDVYVEKPAARSPFEGEQMVAAAKKYHRIVQIGTQTRSAEYAMHARKFIEEGGLGNIEFCRIHNMWPQACPGRPKPAPVPADLLWDVWLGPALYREFSPLYMRGLQWEWFWGLGLGILGVQGIHQIDMARMVLGLKYPKTAYSVGMVNRSNGAEMPDTQSVVFEFDNLIMNVEQTLGQPYMLETDAEVRNSDMFPYWYQNATRVEIYGKNALMVIGRLGAGWQVFVRTKDRKPVVKTQEFGRYTMSNHLFNFVDCIRSRQTPNAPIEEGHQSTMLVHYANMSYRAGGVKLAIDTTTGKVTNCPEIQPFWRPEFRKEYDIPEIG